MCEISHIRTSHRCDVRSGAAKKWLRIVRFWDYEQKFACKVRMCEISHIRTSHTCDVRSGAAENGCGCLGFGIMSENLVARCECAKFRTFAPRTRAMCDRVRPQMVADT